MVKTLCQQLVKASHVFPRLKQNSFRPLLLQEFTFIQLNENGKVFKQANLTIVPYCAQRQQVVSAPSSLLRPSFFNELSVGVPHSPSIFFFEIV